MRRPLSDLRPRPKGQNEDDGGQEDGEAEEEATFPLQAHARRRNKRFATENPDLMSETGEGVTEQQGRFRHDSGLDIHQTFGKMRY